MGEDETSAKPQSGGPASLQDQARAAVNKKGKEAVGQKLQANFAKIREHEIAIAQAKKAIGLLHDDNDGIVAEYEAGLV